MLSTNSIKKYRDFAPDDDCYYLEPSNNVAIVDKKSGITYISPDDETDSTFNERLERSKQSGKNYFFEEWEEYVLDNNMIL